MFLRLRGLPLVRERNFFYYRLLNPLSPATFCFGNRVMVLAVNAAEACTCILSAMWPLSRLVQKRRYLRGVLVAVVLSLSSLYRNSKHHHESRLSFWPPACARHPSSPRIVPV